MSSLPDSGFSAARSDAPEWLLLLRAAALALRGRVMLLALTGIALVGAADSLLAPAGGTTQVEKPVTLHTASSAAGYVLESATTGWHSLTTAWRTFADPFIDIAASDRRAMERLGDLGRIAVRLAVWGILGGAIVRIVALNLTRDEAPDIAHGIGFALRHKAGFLGGPLLLLAGLVAVTVPLVVVRGAMQLDWLAPVAALLWPLVLLAATMATIYAIGTLVGWPLLWGATATDGSDSFDGVSRMFAYVYQKPLRLLGYALAVGGLGWLSATAAELFAGGVVYASQFASGGASADWTLSTVAWWEGLVTALLTAYLTAFIWTSTAGVYLLRRKDVDGVHVDEVHIDAAEFEGGLPKLTPDANGIPQFAEADRAADAA